MPTAQTPRHCYQSHVGDRRCFATERELSDDVLREQVAAERRVEERAKQRALAIVAERDAKEAAARARAEADRADQIQGDAFDLLVEMQEGARERAKAPSSETSATPSKSPE